LPFVKPPVQVNPESNLHTRASAKWALFVNKEFATDRFEQK
jgi:hypothetical protein